MGGALDSTVRELVGKFWAEMKWGQEARSGEPGDQAAKREVSVYGSTVTATMFDFTPSCCNWMVYFPGWLMSW
jgi:hypothetical protein